MLAIRLKRTGRSNLAQYRVIVQDSRRHPKRGAVIEYLGTYDPHDKSLAVDKDRVKHFLSNGAQPSSSLAKLLKADGIKLPKWVTIDKKSKRAVRNPEKLRKNQPEGAQTQATPQAPTTDEAPAEEAPAADPSAQSEKSKDEPETEESKEEPAQNQPAEEQSPGTKAEEPAAEAK